MIKVGERILVDFGIMLVWKCDLVGRQVLQLIGVIDSVVLGRYFFFKFMIVEEIGYVLVLGEDWFCCVNVLFQLVGFYELGSCFFVELFFFFRVVFNSVQE